jgi:nitrate reductase alpha subunit
MPSDADMHAKKQKVEPRITRGNLYTIGVVLAGFVGSMGWTHYVPSEEAREAKGASTEAVQKASEAAAKSAVTENLVAIHTQQINAIAENVDTLRMDMAVVKSQGEAAKSLAQSTSDKLDRLLAAVYRLQGQVGPTKPNTQ